MNKEIFVLLNAKTLNFTPVGGLPTMTSDDVNYLLAHISEAAGKYLRMILASQPGNLDERWILDVSLALRRQIALFEELEYWKPPRPDWILDMGAMALSEAVGGEIGSNRCVWCHGRKEAVVNNLKVVCDNCGGAGFKSINQEDRAKIMETTEDLWSTWTNRYRRILGVIDGWNGEIHLSHAILRRKDENTMQY